MTGQKLFQELVMIGKNNQCKRMALPDNYPPWTMIASQKIPYFMYTP